MGLKDRLQRGVRDAVDTVTHGYDYTRHLVQGNRVPGDISWIKAGEPPVVLVHGFLGTRGTMLPLTRRLQADGRVVFSYAYGTFQMASIRYSAEGLVRHVRTICEDLGAPRVDMIGYSMGGLVGLHAIKFLQGQQWIRRLVMLGTPLAGTWASLAGVATLGAVSSSVWQILPGSAFLEDLRRAPVPPEVMLRQVHAASDGFVPAPGPIEGVAPRDYILLPGRHSSLVVAPHFYEAVIEFLDTADREAWKPPPGSPDLDELATG